MIYQRTATVAPEKTVSPSVLPVRLLSTTGGMRATMKMFPIEVESIGGDIVISQQEPGDEPSQILITPDQAKLVCEWILDAAKAPTPRRPQATLRD